MRGHSHQSSGGLVGVGMPAGRKPPGAGQHVHVNTNGNVRFAIIFQGQFPNFKVLPHKGL